jgi:hypothetical protein
LVEVAEAARNTFRPPEVGDFDSTIGRSDAFTSLLSPAGREAGEYGEDVEINHQQADSGGGREFVWDGSMEAGLVEAINAEAETGHVHGPDCGHSHQIEPTPEMAALEANLIEVAHALSERYGDAGPSPDEEREFMREWLLGKGRSQEEVDAILAE